MKNTKFDFYFYLYWFISVTSLFARSHSLLLSYFRFRQAEECVNAWRHVANERNINFLLYKSCHRWNVCLSFCVHWAVHIKVKSTANLYYVIPVYKNVQRAEQNRVFTLFKFETDFHSLLYIFFLLSLVVQWHKFSRVCFSLCSTFPFLFTLFLSCVVFVSMDMNIE